MIAHPIDQRMVKSNIMTGALRKVPFVSQDLRTLG